MQMRAGRDAMSAYPVTWSAAELKLLRGGQMEALLRGGQMEAQLICR